MTFTPRSLIRSAAPALLAGVLLAGVSVVGSGVALGSVAHPTASSVLASAARALAQESSVHVTVATMNGKATTSVVADIGKKNSTETVTSGKESFTIIVTPFYAYLSGTPTGLTVLMGLTSAEQKKVGRSAIAMKKGTSAYTSFEQNLSSSALVHLLPTVTGTTLLAARDKKTKGYQLSWTTAASATQTKSSTVMVISSGRKALPVDEHVTTPVGHSTTTFTKWNESIHVTVPTSTIAYSKVVGAAS